MLIDNPTGLTIKRIRWGEIGFEHDAVAFDFTNGDTFVLRSSAGYEDSSIQEVEEADCDEIIWNKE